MCCSQILQTTKERKIDRATCWLVYINGTVLRPRVFLVSDVLSRNLNQHEKAWKEKAWEVKELDLLCGKSFENLYGVLKVITPSCWLLLCFLTHQ